MFQFILGLAQYVIILPTVIAITAIFAGLQALGLGNPTQMSLIESFVLVFVGLVVYGAMHAPEIVEFYGMRAARAQLDSGELARSDWLQREKLRPL